MPLVVNIHDAKTNLSRLLERVQQGEEVVIGKAGKPIARLVPFAQAQQPRQPGIWCGKVRIAEDFDELPEDLAGAFRGEQP
jgi:prevent-host-death family protein